MGISDFKKAIYGRKNKTKQDPYAWIFPIDDDIFWTNGCFLVKDDPNLKEYFGTYLLSRLIESDEGKKVYFLDGDKSRIAIVGDDEITKKPFSIASELINLNLDRYRKFLYLPQNNRISTQRDGDIYYIFGSNKPQLFNSEYFDYLEEITHDEILISSPPSSLFFIKDNEVNGVLAPRVISEEEWDSFPNFMK